ncbi:MAG: 2,3-bisphosphoglycerate-dependent phosphoglycerate mutase [Nitrosomonadales bacterium]|nr:MAG: 2,3-bisphosphoglycerate-dependent phosphoglycerate mutase [Nitrosomonadales bacterium]
MTQLVLMRHGQSIWNREGRFTGWSNSALSPQGEHESERAGRLLRQTGHMFDLCFTSELKRATDTVRIVLTTMGLAQLPVQQSWRLNERHFGAMEGYSRLDAVGQFGLWPVIKCQLQFTASPPPLDPSDARFPGNQPRYSNINKEELPLAESVQQTLLRVQPYWQETIVPQIRCGKQVLIVSHKNALRALRLLLEGLSAAQAMRLTIDTGRPLVYELDDRLHPIQRSYLN